MCLASEGWRTCCSTPGNVVFHITNSEIVMRDLLHFFGIETMIPMISFDPLPLLADRGESGGVVASFPVPTTLYPVSYEVLKCCLCRENAWGFL